MMLTRTKGTLIQGHSLIPTQEDLTLPDSIITEKEALYAVGESFSDAERGDYLVVEPRSEAATGELVLVQKGQKVYVGHWWQKHGRRDVLGQNQDVIVSKPTILGAVNLILRGIA